jgi:hypothetical protein
MPKTIRGNDSPDIIANGDPKIRKIREIAKMPKNMMPNNIHKNLITTSLYHSARWFLTLCPN